MRGENPADSSRDLAAGFTQVVHLLDWDRLPQLLDALTAAYSLPADTLSNLHQPADPRTGLVLHLSNVVDLPVPADVSAVHWTAQPLLKLLRDIAAQPEASRRALLTELRDLLGALDGTAVRGEYEAGGTANVAAWVDTLNATQVQLLVGPYDRDVSELVRELLFAWSEPGGFYEDEALRIERDDDFTLFVDPSDAVRRLAVTNPDVLRQAYAGLELDRDLSDYEPEVAEAAVLARTLGIDAP